MTDTADTAQSPTLQTSKAGRSAWKFLRDLLVIVLIAIVVSFFIKTFLVRSFYIPSASMENTLQINDRILVNELQPKVFGLAHGDVVVFTDPGGWLPASPPSPDQNSFGQAVNGFLTFIGLGTADSDDHLIKRVIGLPGDHVVCCGASGQIEVNGKPLDEPYIIRPANGAAGAVPFDVTVPAGQLWVMGDNRYNSQDSSRNQNLPGKGFVPIDDVVGRAFVITWPVNRWTWLGDYPDVFAGVG
ncbi:signal peptidase I [Plantibacter sp. Mn2098]|uniref:signal peptidase I n=1 Tax=Plantibacter sp. Mn2098 TaxID=3395266 RepID=UPI003BD4D85D